MSELRIEQLSSKYIDGLLEVERLSFTTPWNRDTFVYEMESNTLASYYVALIDEQVVGYGGMWSVLNEGHVTNIAVHPLHRRKGIGQTLLNTLLLFAIGSNLTDVTLEVRESNEAARTLYENNGFVVEGRRKGYYSDDKEDALIMWRHFND
ncbi:ribosomal protein S18-alanine N-acetyltransferase [Clostridia bacterium]|nr:ribosomal protein S18-alanine N-acetyltransferase [Clostridia bacterium]